MKTRHISVAKMLAIALLASTLSAQAVEYKTIDAAKSHVTFGYKQMGVGMDGKFKKFAAQLSFDPAKPANAKATLEIDLTAIDTGSSEVDQEVTGKSWFNTNAFPKAVFVSSQIKATTAHQFEVMGKLTLKGQTKDISFPLKQTAQGNVGVFNGSFVMRRADFNIGEGMWAKFDTVANEVQVNFQITALASK